MRMFRLFLLLALSLALAAAACSRRPRSTADVPRSISQAYTVTVAPFTQPIDTGQLIAGILPDPQGRINARDLPDLDQRLRTILSTETRHRYKFITASDRPLDLTLFHAAGQPQGLPFWLAYGRRMGADLLLVPQVLDWHERQGSKAGVTQSAHVRVEFFLLNIPQKALMGRSVFEEKQEGLVNNLLNVGAFIKRRGQWVSAAQLSEDGMRRAARELGL